MAEKVKVDDLVDLWRVGAVHLPQVAVQYSDVARELHRMEQLPEQAFRRSRGGLGRLYHAWCKLRDLVQDEIAVQSHDNLMAAGRVLMQIADAYAITDYLTGDEMREYADRLDRIKAHPHPDQRPPSVPEAVRSSDQPLQEEPSIPVFPGTPF